MAYTVKEIYSTLQGEGAQAGRAAVFLRFAGCNLWSGREQDRMSAICRFCDTDFVGTDGPGGGRFRDADALADAVLAVWHAMTGDSAGATTTPARPYVVCTGGEPLLQLDAALIVALHARGVEIGVETNGTIAPPEGINWLCVSPKGATGGRGAEALAARSGQELKLVYPQAEPEAAPEAFAHLAFEYFFLQPLDVPGDAAATAEHVTACVDYCRRNPQWRLSLQTHKLIGLP